MADNYREKSVLVVEHSPTMARLIKNCLVQLGFRSENISLARDGNQAFLIIELKKFDLITSSQHMRIQTGIELLERLRNSPNEAIRNIPFLMISSETSRQFIADLLQKQASGFLPKPFSYEKLANTLELILGDSPPPFVMLEDEAPAAVAEESLEENGLGISNALTKVFIDSTVEGLAQYLIEAQPGAAQCNGKPLGDFSSRIDIKDEKAGVQIHIILYFPKGVACQAYEALFGEVDIDMVCGVVEELGNIIGGAVKPKLIPFSRSVIQAVDPAAQPPEGTELEFQLGFPQSHQETNHSVNLNLNGVPRFSVPFEVNGGNISLEVLFQKLS